jgi:hypothetical protein
VHSMSREDEAIADYFGDFVGRFLEIGAVDGKILSNCYLLAQEGWGGVCVEGSHRWVDAWFKNYAGMLDRVQLVNEAMGAVKAGWGTFFDCYEDDTASTVDQRLAGLGMSRANHHMVQKYLITARELLARFPGPYHFVSIDIDGMSLPVMKELPFAELETKAVCVEYLHPPNSPSGVKEDAEIVAYLEDHGFKHLLTNQENVLMVRA